MSDFFKKFGLKFGKRKISGESTTEAAKGVTKDVIKDKVKQLIFKALLRIMFPFGLLLLIGIILISCMAIFFTEDNTVLTAQQKSYISQYASSHADQGMPSDVECNMNYEPSTKIIENYIKFLIMQKDISLPLTQSELEKLTKQAFSGLAPKITLGDSTITTTTTTVVKAEGKGAINNSGCKTSTSVNKTKIKEIIESDSVYGKYIYNYKMQQTTQVSNVNGVKTIVVTDQPVLESTKRIDNFDMLTALLEKDGVAKNEIPVAIGAILFSTNDINSWNWLLKDKLPPPPNPSETSDGGYFDGSVAGIPKNKLYLEPFYIEAQNATGIPAWFLVADTYYESGFNPNSVSSTGAVGLLQFEPYNFDDDCTQYGMLNWLHQNGFQGSMSSLKNELRTNAKLQIFVGAWEWRYYFNYTLHMMGKTNSWDFGSTSNMKLIPWNAPVNSNPLEFIIKKAAYIYNRGQAYYNDDSSNWTYSCNVYNLAMKDRSKSNLVQVGSLPKAIQAIVEKAIKAGEACIGNSEYNLGAGRTIAQQKAHDFDCSSFVWYCYDQAGVQLGPLSSVTTTELLNDGYAVRIPASQRQVGDLIFFNTDGPLGHVGIYLGNNQFLNDECHGAVQIASLNSYWSPLVACYARPVINK